MHQLLAFFSSQQRIDSISLVAIEIVAIVDLFLIRLIAAEISRRPRKRLPLLSEEENDETRDSFILSFVKSVSIASMFILAAFILEHLFVVLSR